MDHLAHGEKERESVNRALADLIKISNATGKDPALVQGGGGNTSVKTADGKYMYIKASGTALKDMNEKQGWRRLRLDAVLSIIKDSSIAGLDVQRRETEVVNRLLLACEDGDSSGARPSVESHLHAFLDKCVIHLHPVVVAAYVNAKNGRAELEKLFAGQQRPPLWVPYTDPGFMLAKRISKLVEDYRNRQGCDPAILFLAKHGVFVSAGTADAALKLVHKVTKLCSSKLTWPKMRKLKRPVERDILAAKSAIRKAVFDATGRYQPVIYFPPSTAVAAFMRRKDAAKLLNTAALNPDEQIYANGSAMWLESCDVGRIAAKLKGRIKRAQKPAAAFVVKGLGLFIAADKKIAPVVAEITDGSLLVRMHAAKFGGVLALTKRQQEFIDNWESEAFRKKVVSG